LKKEGTVDSDHTNADDQVFSLIMLSLDFKSELFKWCVTLCVNYLLSIPALHHNLISPRMASGMQEKQYTPSLLSFFIYNPKFGPREGEVTILNNIVFA